MIRKFITLISTVGLLVAIVAFIGVMGSMRPKIERQEAEVTPPTVFYEVADATPVTLDVSAQGEVRPRTDIMLTSQVAGRIVETAPNFVNGGAFEEGDVLVQIEDADYRVAVTSARARLAQALEALRREEAESALAREDYEDLGLGDTPTDLALRVPQLAQARANYSAAQADLEAAQLNLSRTKVTAPFKGRVRELIAGRGQYVAPSAQLGRIFSTDVAEIRMPMTDADLAKLGVSMAFVATEEFPGPKVTLSANVAGQYHEWTGHVVRTDGAIDPATRQISVIAVVEDPYGAGADDGTPLTIGLFVDASIEGRQLDNAFVLPRAVMYGRDSVFVIDAEDTLVRRTVTLLSSNRDTVTIGSGISAGERVVASPLRGANEGDKVIPATREEIERADAPEIATVASEGDAQ